MLLLFVNSCKKEIYDAEKIDQSRKAKMLEYHNGPKVETINLTKFKNTANLAALGILKQEFVSKPTSQQKTMSVNIPETFAGFQLMTDSIKVIRDKGHTIYVFPVKLSSKRALTFQNLTIDESAEGTTAFINTYTPSKKWIGEWKAGKPGKFDGDIGVTYLNLHNNNNLNLPTTGNVSGKGKLSTVNNATSSVRVCNTITYYYAFPFSCGSGNHWPGDEGCALTGESSAGYVYITSTNTTCYDVPDQPGGGGGGGTTPTPPPGYNPCNGGTPALVSYNGAKGAKLMIIQPNPCDSILPQTQEAPPKERTVTDSTSNPCIKAGVGLGMKGNTTIGTMLNKTFGASNEYGGLDLEFIESDTGTDDGLCRKNGNISWVITINQNLPNVASKEYILSTVYHEILHAYLEATYPKDATGIFLIPHDEHQDMAEKYIILMTGALKINYPNLSDKDVWGLAWGGLHETPFYKDNTKLTEDQRNEIKEINRKHKNKNNQSDRSGSYCN